MLPPERPSYFLYISLALVIPAFFFFSLAIYDSNFALSFMYDHQPLGPPLLSNAWRYYTDVWTLPMVFPPGTQSLTHYLNHEHNYDFSAFLYAEGDRVYFVDVPGPVCFTHGFFVSAGGEGRDGQLSATEIFIEVDGGNGTSLGTITNLFKGDYAADLHAGSSGSEAFWQPHLNLTPGEGWGSGHPALPRTLTYTVERVGSVRSGFILHAPICAHEHLRMSWYFPQPDFAPAPVLLQDGSDCVAKNSPCMLPTYTNLYMLRFPGLQLPKGLLAFDPSVSAYDLIARDTPLPPKLEGDVRNVWSPARLLEEALETADSGRSSYKCGKLGPQDRVFEVFAEAREGGGVGTFLTFDFPSAPHMLHSPHVRLEAQWDDGKGSLNLDLEAFFGPLGGGFERGEDERKENFFMGELPRNKAQPRATVHPPGVANVSVVSSGGIYLALPMPWYSAARVVLLYDGVDGSDITSPSPPSLFPFPGSWPPPLQSASLTNLPPLSYGPSFDVCASFLVSRRAIHELSNVWPVSHDPQSSSLFASKQPLGYLQSDAHNGFVPSGDASMSPSLGNFVNINGATGSFVMLSVYHHSTTQFIMEGDIRFWGDGSPTPMIWTSGFEDFFNAGHAYNFVKHHAEAFTAWDRVDVQFYQRRMFALDAPRFLHSLVASYESTGQGPQVWRSAALFYGLPADPPVLTDVLCPHSLLEAASLGGPNGTLASLRYSVSLMAGSNEGVEQQYVLKSGIGSVEEYSLTSLVPSKGDVAPSSSMGGGSGGGVLVTESVFAVLAPAVVKMVVSIHPAARAVVLRRMIDVRRSVAIGKLWVDGIQVARIRTVDRAFDTLNAFWQWETLELPLKVTLGKTSLKVMIQVDVEANVTGRVYLQHQLKPAWTEAKWEVLCFPVGDAL